MDAIVHSVTTRPEMKSLLSVTHHDYLPNEFEPIELESDLFFELQELQVTDGAPAIIKFKIFCYEHDIQYLQAFVDNCNTDYERRMANKLGSHRYFFDQVVQTKVKGTQNPLPNAHLLYTKTKFTTNRSFDNVFFEDRIQVHRRTKFFLEDRAWYDKKGIPYTLGFLFHGPPGTGKTSTVKAIANEGRRHIIKVWSRFLLFFKLKGLNCSQVLKRLFRRIKIAEQNLIDFSRTPFLMKSWVLFNE